jgi:hypothetical protein
MKPVTFAFREGVSREDQDRVLAMIKAFDEVDGAGWLKPDAGDPEVARMAFAYVADETDLSRFVSKLSRVPQIEVASPPAERRLID